MISTYLGEAVFVEGVRQYLNRHIYGNAVTGDLWKALGEASGKDIGTVMDTWTKNVGYPVVSVTEKDSALHLEQHRFLSTGDATPEDDKIIYPVFLNLRSGDKVDDNLTFNTREQTFPLQSLDFYQLNAGYTGFYRTKYPAPRLEKLGQAAGRLGVQDRVGIVADACALATSGYQKTADCLSLFKALAEGGESEFLVWDQMLSRLGNIKMAWIEQRDVFDKLLEFQRNFSSPMAHKLGWEFSNSDDHIQQQFKALMFGSAGSAGDEKVLGAAREMFSKFAAGDVDAIHPNIRGAVLSMNLKYGGESEVSVSNPRYHGSID
jgi:aminopeptidase 2